MANERAAQNQTGAAAKTPPPLSPVVLRVPRKDFTFSQAQYAELENAGGVPLSSELRSRLLNLAAVWVDDLKVRLSPRPKAFRECLEDVMKALSRAEEACHWDDDPLKRHLLHWAMETDVEGAEGLPGRLYGLEDNLKSAGEFFAALMQKLPRDPGRQRPFDDERRILFLGEIYEQAGGKATVYSSEYTEGGIADTPFRSFARCFYSMLPAEDKRDPGGLDEALRLASIGRSAKAAP